MTIPNPAPSAPDENHLCPSITHSSPSSTARVCSPVGSEPETSGSVIEKNDRVSPSTSGAQEPLLLLVRPEHVEDLAVARVGRLAVEDELGPEAAPDLLVQVGVVEEPFAAAAGLGREVRRPEPLCLRPRAQLGDRGVRRVVLAREHRLGRVDVLLHERPVALPHAV